MFHDFIKDDYMGKKLCMAVMAGVFVLLLGGCQQTATTGKKVTSTGTAVMAGQTENQKENDFWTRVDEKLSYQHAEISGPKGQRYVVAGNTDQWMYYIKEDEKQGEQQLCRIPASAKKGDHFLFDKESVLFSESLFFDTYVTDTYVIFIASSGSGDSRCFKLELSSGKCTALGGSREFYDCEMVVSENGTPVLLHDCLFVTTDKGVYELDPQKGQMHKIYDRTDMDYSVRMQTCGDCIYFTSDRQEIYRYDGDGKEAVCVLDEKTIQEKLDALKLWGEDSRCKSYGINNIFSYEECLYIDAAADGEKQGKCTAEGILLSTRVSDIKNIKHENILFDCLTLGEEGKESGEGAVNSNKNFNDVYEKEAERPKVYRPSRIRGIVDGKVVLDGVEIRPPQVSSISFKACRAFDPVTGKVTDNPEIEIIDSDISHTGYRKK